MMEFLSRSRPNPPQASNDVSPPPTRSGPPPPPSRRKHIDFQTRTVRIELFVITLGCALLLIAVSLFLGVNAREDSNSEVNAVDTNSYQAVFLNGGATSGTVQYSTYFGHIRVLNDKYIVMDDVYYLTAGQSKAATTTSELTKLGCQQLHAPYDQMIINRNQIAYWENIRGDGQVGKAIAEYKKQNPKGPNCKTTTKTKANDQPATQTESTTP